MPKNASASPKPNLCSKACRKRPIFSTKKQIVEASLKAFGVPIEKIIEAGVAEIEALEFYIRSGASDTEKVLQDGSDAHPTIRTGNPKSS